MLITLIMLAVMGVAAAMAIKLSINTDYVAANMRSRQIAFQAAEVALRHCERLITASPQTTPVIVNYNGRYANSEWLDNSQWTSAFAQTPDLDKVGLRALLRDPIQHPKCIIRHFTLDEWRQVVPPTPFTVTAESRGFDSDRFVFYRITARGFSPDYAPPQVASDVRATKGAEVRLQSLIRAIQ